MFSRVLCSATVCLALGGESFKAHDPHDPVVAKRVGQGSFENCFRRSAISSLDGGQFESHVLQWNTNAPDFNASSNSSWLNATVWLWLFGQTISNSNRSLIRSPAASIFCRVFALPLRCVTGRLANDFQRVQCAHAFAFEQSCQLLIVAQTRRAASSGLRMPSEGCADATHCIFEGIGNRRRCVALSLRVFTIAPARNRPGCASAPLPNNGSEDRRAVPIHYTSGLRPARTETGSFGSRFHTRPRRKSSH
jgi:hypothetical protein